MLTNNVLAQQEKKWIKHQITTLSGSTMHGRGYVNKGGAKAAGYIQRQFIEYGLTSFSNDSNFFQPYQFSVNTFPGNVSLIINKKALKPGADYIVHAASASYHSSKKLKLKKVDVATIKDSAALQQVLSGIRSDRAYLIENADSLTKNLKLTYRLFAKQFPKGLFIVPKQGKLIWTVATDTVPATIVYVEDTVMPKRPKKVLVNIDTKFEPAFKTQNVIGYVPGTAVPDSFIVFTAHYDHLGHMGKQTVFPGAHDNASGTSLMLYLANYFAKHPQRYSVAFMAFSGEEAGLLGSKYYVNNPLFPLEKIRFVTNLDMTGNAKDGITVVNAKDNPDEFALLSQLNTDKSYLPKLNERENTSNSDHYPFTTKGVPAVFIYGLGAKGYYHDIFDTAKELSLDNIDNLAKLLIDFTGKLSEGQ
jgi:hypothetical protein